MIHTIAVISIVLGILSSIYVAINTIMNPQKMWIMDLVWPITALWSNLFGLAGYLYIGRKHTKRGAQKRQMSGTRKSELSWKQILVGTTHCGAGCSLGDLIAEWTVFLFGWTLLGRTIWAGWVLDFILAFLFGIAFQYFSIKPMKNLSRFEGLKAALKADGLSLTAWQIGMYGWTAIVEFLIFGRALSKTEPVFWFMMQIAMFFGFLTSFPVNWWLLRSGIKERM